MPITGGYTDPSKGSEESEYALLPVREHAAELLSVTVETGKPHPKSQAAKDGVQEVRQLKWTFKGLKWREPETEKEGVISIWTGFNYGSPKAKLTPLLNAIFGRSLTEDEALNLDYERFVGVVKGWVMVSPKTKEDGTQGVQFGGFRWPDKVSPPEPSEFYVQSKNTPPLAKEPVTDDSFANSAEDEGDPFA